jgi:hypothetical protein
MQEVDRAPFDRLRDRQRHRMQKVARVPFDTFGDLQGHAACVAFVCSNDESPRHSGGFGWWAILGSNQ